MLTATRTRTELHASAPLAVRRLRDEGDGVLRVGVVQTAAMLVDGDDVTLDVRVGAGERLILQDISATLAHPMVAGARQRVTLHLARDSRLALLEEPLIVAAGASVVRDVSVTLEPGARLLHRETLVLGRFGEEGGRLAARSRVVRDGRPVVDDTIDTSVCSPAVLGGARVVSSLSLFGTPVPPLRGAFALGPSDTLIRRLSSSTLTDLDDVEHPWRAAVFA